MGRGQCGCQRAKSLCREGAQKAVCPSPTAHNATCSVLLMPLSHRDYTVNPFSHPQISNPFPFPAEITSSLLQSGTGRIMLGKKNAHIVDCL